MKKSRILKLLVPGIFIVALLIPIATSAYTGSYSFRIAAKVEGTTKHSLANKSTTTTVQGQTYLQNGTVNSKKATFYVVLDGPWLTNYETSNITANGSSYSKSFGVVKSNDYTINVHKSSTKTYGEYIQGNGTIKQ